MEKEKISLSMPYGVIQEQGDLGLGFNPITKKEEKDKENKKDRPVQ